MTGLQTIPTAFGALALTWLSGRWGASHGSTTLAIAAVLISLMGLAALLGLDLRPLWEGGVLLVFGLLIGVALGTWQTALLDRASSVMGVGIVLTAGAGISGCFLRLRHGSPLARGLAGLAWLYLIGWIPFLAADNLSSYSAAWAAFGLGVLLLLTAIWTASIRNRDTRKTPARTSLQLYLLVLNIILALTVILSSGG